MSRISYGCKVETINGTRNLASNTNDIELKSDNLLRI